MSWEDRDPNLRHVSELECVCGHRFSVAESLKGGMVNCPSCRRLMEIPRGVEPAFWLVLCLGIVIGLAITATAASVGGVEAGVIAFLICAAIMIGILVFL